MFLRLLKYKKLIISLDEGKFKIIKSKKVY